MGQEYRTVRWTMESHLLDHKPLQSYHLFAVRWEDLLLVCKYRVWWVELGYGYFCLFARTLTGATRE